MNDPAFIYFMPWATLPTSCNVLGFRMIPVVVDQIDPETFGDRCDEVKAALNANINRSGASIESCTIIAPLDRDKPYHPMEHNIDDVFECSKALALACLAEQRFYEGHGSPHMNSSMFEIIGMPIQKGVTRISLHYRRRGGGLRNWGMQLSDVRFQQPYHTDFTQSVQPSVLFLEALQAAKLSNSKTWTCIRNSLDFFLLANSELPQLQWESCCLLSAIAFEKLLEPSEANARRLSEAFVALWDTGADLQIRNASRVKVDNFEEKSKTVEQEKWPVRQKWIKELYELRSSTVHSGPRTKYSVNWQPMQHMVQAAFAYPICVKLMLNKSGLYTLTPYDQVHRDVFDKLLDSDPGQGSETCPNGREFCRLLKG